VAWALRCRHYGMLRWGNLGVSAYNGLEGRLGVWRVPRSWTTYGLGQPLELGSSKYERMGWKWPLMYHGFKLMKIGQDW
jgi:hypothetical protein